MTILVTGSSGFIGSHVVSALCGEENRVVGIDNYNSYYDIRQKRANTAKLEKKFPLLFQNIEGDIRDARFIEEIFSEHSFSAVIHLAAMAGVRASFQNPFLTEEVNVRGTLQIFDASLRFGVQKVVYASSSSVYGNSPIIPFREDMTLRPISPYASTKLTNENDAYIFSHIHKLPTIGLRFFTVYGPAGRPDMAPFLFTDRVMRGLPIPKFGDGTSRRDYTFIDDIVSGILSALDYSESLYEVFNLGNSKTISLNEFIALIERLSGKKATIAELPPQSGDVQATHADIAKARNLLNYSPTTSVDAGMEKFVKWYLSERTM